MRSTKSSNGLFGFQNICVKSIIDHSDEYFKLLSNVNASKATGNNNKLADGLLDSRMLSIYKKYSYALLQAPTGTGKTTILAESVFEVSNRINTKWLWIWVAPQAAVVKQTFQKLNEKNETFADDLKRFTLLGDGSGFSDLEKLVKEDSAKNIVILQTWAGLQTSNGWSRNYGGSEKADFAKKLRDIVGHEYLIGFVVDEAHHSLSKDTGACAIFKNIMPNFALFASATPNLKDFDNLGLDIPGKNGHDHIDFEGLSSLLPEANLNAKKLTSIVKLSRIDAIEAGLIHSTPELNFVSASLENLDELIEAKSSEAIIRKLMERVEMSMKKFDKHFEGSGLSPLCLIQVENSASDVGAENEIAGSTSAKQHPQEALVRSALKAILFSKSAAADESMGGVVKTSFKKSEETLHDYAADNNVRYLIFKMDAATGFDAPRACILVSLRDVISDGFATQVVGRILRVPQKVPADFFTKEKIEATKPEIWIPVAAKDLGHDSDSMNKINKDFNLMDKKGEKNLGNPSPGKSASLTSPAIATVVKNIDKELSDEIGDENSGDDGSGESAVKVEVDDVGTSVRFTFNNWLSSSGKKKKDRDKPETEPQKTSRAIEVASDPRREAIEFVRVKTAKKSMNSKVDVNSLAEKYFETFSEAKDVIEEADGILKQKITISSRDMFNINSILTADKKPIRTHLTANDAKIVRQELVKKCGNALDNYLVDDLIPPNFRPETDFDYEKIKIGLFNYLAKHVNDNASYELEDITDEVTKDTFETNESSPLTAKSLYSFFPRLNKTEDKFAKYIDSHPEVLVWFRINNRKRSVSVKVSHPFMMDTEYSPDFFVVTKSKQVILIDTKSDYTMEQKKAREKADCKHKEYGHAFYVVENSNATGWLLCLPASGNYLSEAFTIEACLKYKGE